jgi:hypothetical protein
MQPNNIPPPIDVQRPMPAEQKPKRPTSHVFVIGFLSFMTVGFAIFLLDLANGRSGASSSFRQNWLVIVFLGGGAFALSCLIVGGRHRWAYYVTSGLLGLWALRGLNTAITYAWLFASGKRPASTPYYHLAERHKPLVEQQQITPARALLIAAVVTFIVWLFLRFTFSRASRNYFQLKKRTTNDPA